MAARPIADWQAALDEMEVELAATLARLDSHQSVLGQTLEVPGHRPHRAIPNRPAQDWDRWSRTATELTAAIGHELDERVAAVAEWRARVAQWRSELETTAGRQPEE